MTPTPNLSLILALLALPLTLESAVPQGMVLRWADEFEYTGAPDPQYWTHEIGGGGWGNEEVQVYTDSLDNSRVEDGRLIIEVQTVEGGRVPGFTSARLITRDKVEFTYGRIEVKARMPKTTGTWSAIWMLAANQTYGTAFWPDNGEIDIVEHVGYREDPLYKDIVNNQEYPNILGTTHTWLRNGNDNSGIGGDTYLAGVTEDYHVYALNWTEDRLEWEVDGVVYFSQDYPTFRVPPEDPWKWWPFDQDFFLILNIAVGGNLGGIFNSTFFPSSPYGTKGIDYAAASWPQRMEVDYVRVYEAATEWKGLPIDAMGNAATNSWLGTININAAPWIYSYSLGDYLYMPSTEEETFRSDSQWIYLPR